MLSRSMSRRFQVRTCGIVVLTLLAACPARAQETVGSCPIPAPSSTDKQKAICDFERYRTNLGTIGSALLEGAWIKARAGVTNNDGDSSSVSGVAIDLDGTVVDSGIDVGWYGRPIIRDILLHNGEGFPATYWDWRDRRRKGAIREGDWKYWAIVDAFKIDLTVGYGTVLNDKQGDGNAVTEKKGVYTARLRWEVPLDIYGGRNPFD